MLTWHQPCRSIAFSASVGVIFALGSSFAHRVWFRGLFDVVLNSIGRDQTPRKMNLYMNANR